jgi:hypothetical protein
MVSHCGHSASISGASMRLFLFASLLIFASLAPFLQVEGGVGWYLLKPPLRTGIKDEEILQLYPEWRGSTKRELHEIAPQVMGDWHAPLSRWIHEGSFDSAAECERARVRLIEFEKSREREIREKYPDGYPTLGTTLMRNSRCIASDDPRLLNR